MGEDVGGQKSIRARFGSQKAVRTVFSCFSQRFGCKYGLKQGLS